MNETVMSLVRRADVYAVNAGRHVERYVRPLVDPEGGSPFERERDGRFEVGAGPMLRFQKGHDVVSSSACVHHRRYAIS
jgi:hypothetical protein